MELDPVVENGTVVTIIPERQVLRGGAVGAAGGRVMVVAKQGSRSGPSEILGGEAAQTKEILRASE